jgi:hypothetical protein
VLPGALVPVEELEAVALVLDDTVALKPILVPVVVLLAVTLRLVRRVDGGNAATVSEADP